MSKKIWIIACTLLVTAAQSYAESARNYIRIVGSSTVYPFAETVAETFETETEFNRPKIESTGSGFGFKLFCSGIGDEYPDITNASRAIKKSEIEKCKKNGIQEIVEIKIGYDGIAIARDKNSVDIRLSLNDIFLALAREVPDPRGGEKLVKNPYKTWREVNSNLPDQKIEVLGPPPTSGTRDAFAELVMEGGCKTISWIKEIRKNQKVRFKNICHSIREDGVYIESGENDNYIVNKLSQYPNALGIFGYSFLDQNKDRIKGCSIEGVKPDFDSIADGSYPVSRPLFFYVKQSHIGKIPGIKMYLKEFTSEKSFSAAGYLSKRGLIPMSEGEREKYRNIAMNIKTKGN